MKNKTGSVNWIDLTVPNAVEVKDFYKQVTGWQEYPVSMGDYDDFSMIPKEAEAPVTGICHAQGTNKNLPAQWLIYILVDDLNVSIEQCKKLGGKLLVGPKKLSENSNYCVIEDPAGAVAALYDED